MERELAIEKSFEEKRHLYFTRLSLRLKEAMRLHKNDRLWERNKEKGVRDWRNVSRHCLVGSARMEVLTEWLGLPEAVRNNAVIAYALHDADKRLEVEAMKDEIKKGETGQAAIQESFENHKKMIKKAGFNDQVISMLETYEDRPGQLFDFKKIIDKYTTPGELSDEDIGKLLIFYVDGISIDDKDIEPSELADNGKQVNVIERRMAALEMNPNYKKKNEEMAKTFSGHPFFEGKSYTEAVRDLLHLIEIILCKRINEKSDRTLDPVELPEVIESELDRRINAL